MRSTPLFTLLQVATSVACADRAGSPAPDTASVTPRPMTLTWRPVDTVDGPPARATPSLAALGEAMVLFGGEQDGAFPDDTWVYEQGAWRVLTLDVRPRGRREAHLVALEGRLILWGGITRDAGGSFTVLDDTWAFDGEAWEPLDTAVAPRIRGGGGGVGDGRIVAYGGLDDALTRNETTWFFDGETWAEQLLEPSPPPVRNASMTTVNGVPTLTGGSTPAASAEVWQFRDEAWHHAGDLGFGRAYHCSAALRGHVVVFGGVETSTIDITATDVWPGPFTREGEEPASSDDVVMVSVGDRVLMWGYDPPALWELTAAAGELL